MPTCSHSDRKECCLTVNNNNCKCCYLEEDIYSMLTDVEMAEDNSIWPMVSPIQIVAWMIIANSELFDLDVLLLQSCFAVIQTLAVTI